MPNTSVTRSEEAGPEQEFILNFRFYSKKCSRFLDLSFLVCSLPFPFKYDRSHVSEEWDLKLYSNAPGLSFHDVWQVSKASRLSVSKTHEPAGRGHRRLFSVPMENFPVQNPFCDLWVNSTAPYQDLEFLEAE